MFGTIEEVQAALEGQSYIAERQLATAVFLALRLSKPLLLEGEAGVGKTELAKALATSMGARMIRLQGYEGIDVSSAVYEWNYARQIMAIRAAEIKGVATEALDVFGPDFLIKRPILQALEADEHGPPPILLIDELDRADDEFEAFLLEVLSDFQVTIPEVGTITAVQAPTVLITSNRTRELHDALKRRCLYQWIPYPSAEKELGIVRVRIPDIAESLGRQVVSFAQHVRKLDLYKPPGMAETIDWARGLIALQAEALSEEPVRATLGVLLKNHEDIDQVTELVSELLEAARSA